MSLFTLQVQFSNPILKFNTKKPLQKQRKLLNQFVKWVQNSTFLAEKFDNGNKIVTPPPTLRVRNFLFVCGTNPPLFHTHHIVKTKSASFFLFFHNVVQFPTE